ncbi:DUF2855 family protein [Streptomyces sp. NPDC051567]|uniref:DUF2855 family protein n=1 Tax=Streptomyces sp. NPDC051567 TaxID=3365660 RepID=UPI0037BB22D9
MLHEAVADSGDDASPPWSRHDDQYDRLASAPVEGPATLVDFTGQPERLLQVYDHFAGDLTQTLLVGYTHPGARIAPPQGLTDPVQEIFFTPPEEEQAIAAEGAESYLRRYATAEERYVKDSASWLSVRRLEGPDGLLDALDALLAGELPAHTGTVISPS